MTELELKIKSLAEKYYDGEPEVSDEEFDLLIDELRAINPDSPILTSVGWGSEDYEYGTKFDHKYQTITGLAKIKNVHEIPAYKFPVVSAKLDGLSAVLYYENGELVRALTRHNGYQGTDITPKIKIIAKDVLILKDNFTGAIRGELVIANNDWDTMKANGCWYANSRNAAAGLINCKEESEFLKYVSFVAYNFVGYENLETEINQGSVYRFLTDNGFKVCPHTYKNPPYTFTEESLKELYDEYCELYPCDGVVIGDMTITKSDNSAIIYNQIAFKFQAEIKNTTVKYVEWRLTRTGRVVPLVHVEPVELSGATVRKCSGYNAKYILDNKITEGSKIMITRSNEVIPKIIKVIE